MDILLDLAKEIGLEPKKVASTGGGEYHCACPICGGRDRFFIQPNYRMKNCLGRYACRHCDIKGDTIRFCQEIMGLDWKQAIVKSHANVAQKTKLSFYKPVNNQIKPPPIKWQEKAKAFVDWASKEIKKRPDILDWLEQRGISQGAIKDYQIGYTQNPNSKYGEFRRPFSEFGLSEEFNQDGQPKKIWIPKGIVIPTIEPSGAVVRLKIRRDDFKHTDKIPKYIAVSGSMQGMNLIGDRKSRVMAVVESELDAYALHCQVKDFALVVSIGSNNKNPDSFTDHLAKSKQFLLICHDNDEGGMTMLEKWKGFYPHSKAYPTPIGKDIGEAVRNRLSLREWLLAGLPNELYHKD
jgi:DNA primase